MLNVLHAELVRVLDGMTADLSAAEAHGCLCGALCADGDYSLAQWLAEVAPEPGNGIADPSLSLLFRDTARALQGEELEFAPLLPDDDIALAQRTQALAQWTQGFLYGLAAGDIGRRVDLPEDVTEVLRDFAEISRASLRDGDDPAADEAGDEADEAAFAELYEFVRVGAQLVYDELLPLRRAGSV